MFNGDIKKQAFERLDKSNQQYQKQADKVKDNAGKLHNLRLKSANDLIKRSEDYINTLANSPKEFEKTINEYKQEFKKFETIIQEIKNSDNVSKVTGTTAGAGFAAGAGVAAFGPTVALSIATTFGTASTGTAISALSGAAATNAALAWLGGGAVVAGGGGMAAGNALLALAGPIGWAIGGAAIIGGVFWARNKNAKLAEKANEEAVRINGEKAKLEVIGTKINQEHKTTEQLYVGATNQLDKLVNSSTKNYNEFSQELKDELKGLINNIHSLSVRLNTKIA